VAREREGKKKDMNLNRAAHLFFDAAIMTEVKRRPLLLSEVSLALPRS
jgi:hypothetical protein